ncbi:winged helix-turn-helix transcriptional regulator [Flavitalea antarctica]
MQTINQSAPTTTRKASSGRKASSARKTSSGREASSGSKISSGRKEIAGGIMAPELHKRSESKSHEPIVTPEQCTRHLSAVGDAMYVIGGKWKLRIIIALKDGNKRFNDLQRAVTGISARVLSTELKDLELNGFVSRHVYPYTPVTVEYLVTDYAETLEPVLVALGEWGFRHREKVMASSRNERQMNKS